MSAIVPNIDEVNAWLGADRGFSVESDYRPSIAEFSYLESSGSGNGVSVSLHMHPHEETDKQYSIGEFLTNVDFRHYNPATGRFNTLPFASVMAQALGAARKALAMGSVAVYSSNKRGPQGAIALAEALHSQLQFNTQLLEPIDFSDRERVAKIADYLEREYGENWAGTKVMRLGAVLHHGDIPQETREVLEAAIRDEIVNFTICTSTLAEGVNLPIRTLVLYSVVRAQGIGNRVAMSSRDIKNLVGRAGRAGANTKGLVICANSEQWNLILPVAKQGKVGAIHGALISAVLGLQNHLRVNGLVLTNEILESSPALNSLVDGVDSTLIDLLSEEIGEEELIELAKNLAGQTFASRQADESTQLILEDIFLLRAERVGKARQSGRLIWMKQTSARLRLVDSVEADLLPMLDDWDSIKSPMDADLLRILLGWCWSRPELEIAIRRAYRIRDDESVDAVKESFARVVSDWLHGMTFHSIAQNDGRSMDEILGIFAGAIFFELQTLVEQGVTILKMLLGSLQKPLSPAVDRFSEHLRFGVPSETALALALGGLRHRRAAWLLGRAKQLQNSTLQEYSALRAVAHKLLLDYERIGRNQLGDLVYESTVDELAPDVR